MERKINTRRLHEPGNLLDPEANSSICPVCGIEHGLNHAHASEQDLTEVVTNLLAVRRSLRTGTAVRSPLEDSTQDES